ncbi:hypothetical protein XHV734_2670 [Xanthomonas hortorum pv. vitians]|nr:hypothetical protein XHV734_2670 [Xanthomonas hortorum pv. vitians]
MRSINDHFARAVDSDCPPLPAPLEQPLGRSGNRKKARRDRCACLGRHGHPGAALSRQAQ